MTDGHVSSNGSLHHDDRDQPSPPMPTTIDDVAAALGALAADTRDQYLVIGERLQALHDRGGAHEDASIRRHNATLKAVQTQADATLAVAAELSAMGRHVERLAAKADVVALGAQVGRQALDSVTAEARQDAKIAKVERAVVLRRGVVLTSVGVGAIVAWEHRAILKALLSLLGG